MATELHYRDGGTWRKARELHYRDAGTWRKLKEAWYKDGGTWRRVFSNLAIVLTDRTVVGHDDTFFSPTPSATAGITVANSGTLSVRKRGNISGDADTDLSTEWMVGSGTVADYECRFTPTSGTLSTGATGWLSCSSSRYFAVLQSRSTIGTSTKTCVGTLEIRRVADAVVVASANITLSATATFEN